MKWAPIKDSDHPAHQRNFTSWPLGYPKSTKQGLTRMRGCTVRSESSHMSLCRSCCALANKQNTLKLILDKLTAYQEHQTGNMSRDMTKPTKWLCAQRRLRSAWASAQSDQSSLSAWRNIGPLATHWAHREDSDHTGRMPRLIWVFAGRTLNVLVLSSRGSVIILKQQWTRP